MRPNARREAKASSRAGRCGRSGGRVWTRRWIAICLAAMTLWAGASKAPACMIPVFRYAMERWPADIYGILVFHRGPLSEADRKAVEWMKKTANSEKSYANCEIRSVDVSGKMDEQMQAIWKAQASAKSKQGAPTAPKLPWMVVLYPRSSRLVGLRPAWWGPFSMDAARKALDSPKRRELARRLVAGDSAVWVLLESGKAQADQAAAKLLAGVLKKMEATLELPNPQAWYDDPAVESQTTPGQAEDDDEDDDKDASASLRVAFPILRLSRKDPAEQVFVKMLMRTEPDLEAEYATAVMTFPVIGRGRALFALVARGINEDNIQEACEFVVGPCSCRVKQLNPGTDLLMAVDWDTALENALVEEQPVPVLPGSLAAAASVAAGDPPPEANPSEPTTSTRPAGAATRPRPMAKLKRPARTAPPPAEKRKSVWPAVLWTVGSLGLAALLLALWAKGRAPRS